jgi:hypothetical protein
MTETSTPSSEREVLLQLLGEHAGLRALIRVCEAEARAVIASGAGPVPLLARVVELLEAVEAHNRAEEAVLRPLLLAGDSFGGVRVDDMVEAHAAEHTWLRQALREAAELQVADRAARVTLDVLRTLESHMNGEEAEFLNDRVLRDDLVTVDTSTG